MLAPSLDAFFRPQPRIAATPKTLAWTAPRPRVLAMRWRESFASFQDATLPVEGDLRLSGAGWFSARRLPGNVGLKAATRASQELTRGLSGIIHCDGWKWRPPPPPGIPCLAGSKTMTSCGRWEPRQARCIPPEHLGHRASLGEAWWVYVRVGPKCRQRLVELCFAKPLKHVVVAQN